MDKKEVEREKTAERIQRLLNGDFSEKEFELAIAYENSVKSGSKNRQQAID